MTRTNICQPTTLEFYKSSKPSPQPSNDEEPKGGKEGDDETQDTVYALELLDRDGDVCRFSLQGCIHSCLSNYLALRFFDLF